MDQSLVAQYQGDMVILVKEQHHYSSHPLLHMKGIFNQTDSSNMDFYITGYPWRDRVLQVPTENHPSLIEIQNHQQQGYHWVHSHPDFQHLYKLTRSWGCTLNQTWSATTMTAQGCSTGVSPGPWRNVCSADRRWPPWSTTTMWWSACLLNMTALS